jgi:putative nucleotidyltransferase with HDIG domain
MVQTLYNCFTQYCFNYSTSLFMSILRRAIALQDAETVAHLRSIPFFAKLSDDTLTRLVTRCPLQTVPAQQNLFQQGDTGEALYVIVSGEIEIIQTLDGTPIRLSVFRAGEYFGEMALLDDAPRSATARTLQDSVLLQVRKQDFLALLSEHPGLFTDAARVLSARLRDMNAQQLLNLQREKGELEQSNQRLRSSYQATLEALSVALDLRDQATQGHSQRVAAYTLLIADALDVPQDQREALRHGALLHDIGKIGVSDAILRKTTTLTTNEWEEMKKHPEWGAAIVERIEFLRDARDIILAHHEKFDGTGYPNGLRGAAIPLGARIFAIADVFDAVTTFRPYRMPMSPQDALALIRRDSGRHFDPQIIAAFEQALPQMVEVMRASFATQ